MPPARERESNATMCTNEPTRASGRTDEAKVPTSASARAERDEARGGRPDDEASEEEAPDEEAPDEEAPDEEASGEVRGGRPSARQVAS